MLCSDLLRYYAIGLPIFGLDAVLVPAYYAAGRPWIPTIIGVVCVALKLGLLVLCAPHMGVPPLRLPL